MTIAYFDCSSGVAGDMVLGAMIDAGLPLALVRRELSKLPLGSYRLVLERRRFGLSGCHVRVDVRREPGERSWQGLDAAIAGSALRPRVKRMARAIFRTLAMAEARAHARPLGRVHFHEVGATDSVVDVVGAALGFDHFDFDEVHASPLPISRGRIRSAHGTLPVPAPAALEILKGIPLEPSPVRREIVTPTGAAILATAAQSFGECPLQRIERVGTGFGDQDIPGIPNALRLLVGEGFPAVVIETNLDDMNPELVGHVLEGLLAAGAADAHLEPVLMKKGRAALKLVAVAPWRKKDAVIEAILAETTSFGVRYWPVERRVLVRELVTRRVRGSAVTFKLGYDAKGRFLKAVPEYRDVLRLAKKLRRPLVEVYREAVAEGERAFPQTSGLRRKA